MRSRPPSASTRRARDCSTRPSSAGAATGGGEGGAGSSAWDSTWAVSALSGRHLTASALESLRRGRHGAGAGARLREVASAALAIEGDQREAQINPRLL